MNGHDTECGFCGRPVKHLSKSERQLIDAAVEAERKRCDIIAYGKGLAAGHNGALSQLATALGQTATRWVTKKDHPREVHQEEVPKTLDEIVGPVARVLSLARDAERALQEGTRFAPPTHCQWYGDVACSLRASFRELDAARASDGGEGVSCTHTVVEMDVAAVADGMCPLCARDRIATLESEKKELAEALLGVVEAHGCEVNRDKEDCHWIADARTLLAKLSPVERERGA